MRILVSCVPTAGHFYPVVPLARALQSHGHAVTVAAPPGFAVEVESAGLLHVPVGPDDSTIAREFARYRPEVERLPVSERRPFLFSKRFGEIAAPLTAEELVEACRRLQPDVVAHDTAALAGPLAAAVSGARAVHHSFGPVPEAAVTEAVERAVEPLWRRWNVEPEPAGGLFRDVYVDICPPALQTPELERVSCRRVALRPGSYDGPVGPEVAPVRSARPMVYVTLGTEQAFSRLEVFRTVLDGLAELDVDIVVTVGRGNDPEELTPLPSGVRVFRFLRQSLVVAVADVVVTHGGSGSTLGALRYGRPVLALPAGANQFENARQLVHAGAGLALPPSEVSPAAIHSAVTALLRDRSYRDAARAIADEIEAMPDAATVAAGMESLLRLPSPDAVGRGAEVAKGA